MWQQNRGFKKTLNNKKELFVPKSATFNAVRKLEN